MSSGGKSFNSEVFLDLEITTLNAGKSFLNVNLLKNMFTFSLLLSLKTNFQSNFGGKCHVSVLVWTQAVYRPHSDLAVLCSTWSGRHHCTTLTTLSSPDLATH